MTPGNAGNGKRVGQAGARRALRDRAVLRAAFALPLLARLDLKLKRPQVLALTPTRELSIQVAEAFQQYASQPLGG